MIMHNYGRGRVRLNARRKDAARRASIDSRARQIGQLLDWYLRLAADMTGPNSRKEKLIINKPL